MKIIQNKKKYSLPSNIWNWGFTYDA